MNRLEMNPMAKPRGILVFGANASGKSTIGRELARLLGFYYMRHQDYHFVESEIPYTMQRPYEECLGLMLSDIEKHRSFVLSALTGDFGEQIPALYELAVWVSAPLELRMERFDRRAYERHGERIRENGDMAEQHKRFMDFVRSRPLERIDQWARTLTCPIIRVDGTEDWRVNTASVAEQFMKIAL